MKWRVKPINIFLLPDDIVFVIFTYLPFNVLIRFQKINKRIQTIVKRCLDSFHIKPSFDIDNKSYKFENGIYQKLYTENDKQLRNTLIIASKNKLTKNINIFNIKTNCILTRPHIPCNSHVICIGISGTDKKGVEYNWGYLPDGSDGYGFAIGDTTSLAIRSEKNCPNDERYEYFGYNDENYSRQSLNIKVVLDFNEKYIHFFINNMHIYANQFVKMNAETSYVPIVNTSPYYSSDEIIGFSVVYNR